MILVIPRTYNNMCTACYLSRYGYLKMEDCSSISYLKLHNDCSCFLAIELTRSETNSSNYSLDNWIRWCASVSANNPKKVA